MTSCDEIRERLLDAAGAGGPPVIEHLAGCAGCRGFADRSAAARDLLRAHHLAIEPDPGFATRVSARVERPAELLAWAALRLLPAALALTVVLGALVPWEGMEAGDPLPGMSADASADDLLEWAIEPPGGD